ncbi:MAG: hypothetical protein Q9195_006188 [Heterodermia aff. obscurata]
MRIEPSATDESLLSLLSLAQLGRPKMKLINVSEGDEQIDAGGNLSGSQATLMEAKDPGMKARNAKTFDGFRFPLPNTPDMVTQLFSPARAKNVGDLVIVTILVLHLVSYCLLPPTLRVPVFGALFALWRVSYNGGIGFLLRLQSTDQRLSSWAQRSRLFTPSGSAKSDKHDGFHRFLKSEMETSVKDGYAFEKAPVEFNTWLLFRRLADLVLMSDFTSYCLFAAACGGPPLHENPLLTWLRWIVGLSLIGINVWVKLDAHRVVRENWYWADFFFVIEQEMECTGIFRWFKDPMYTVGYIGYYGISLMAGSYRVLIVSLAAHAAQMAFLRWVEEPHFEKIYGKSQKED